jgi:hypothetical protein
VVETRAPERPQSTPTRNVEGNARLTGSLGAALFVLLAVEGVTLLSVRSLLSVHSFVGVLVGAFALTKLASVGYRFARYYLGDPAYGRKGPPHPILRVAGPLVAVTTVALVGTGVALLAAGRDHDSLRTLHTVSFILWFAAMTVHVLGHLLDTPRLATADFRADEPAVLGRGRRITALVVTLVTGIGFGVLVLSSGWLDGWHRGFGR